MENAVMVVAEMAEQKKVEEDYIMENANMVAAMDKFNVSAADKALGDKIAEAMSANGYYTRLNADRRRSARARRARMAAQAARRAAAKEKAAKAAAAKKAAEKAAAALAKYQRRIGRDWERKAPAAIVSVMKPAFKPVYAGFDPGHATEKAARVARASHGIPMMLLHKEVAAYYSRLHLDHAVAGDNISSALRKAVTGTEWNMDSSVLKHITEATKEELMTLKGIGSLKAEQILTAVANGARLPQEFRMIIHNAKTYEVFKSSFTFGMTEDEIADQPVVTKVHEHKVTLDEKVTDIRKKQGFAKQALKNKLDRRQVKLQELSFEKKGHVVPSVSTFGMNKMTRAFFEMAKAQSHVVNDNGRIFRYNNMMEMGAAKVPFTDEMIQLDLMSMNDKEKTADFIDLVMKNGLAIQYTNTDIRVWVKKVAKKMSVYTVYSSSELEPVTEVEIGDNRSAGLNAMRKEGGTWKKYCFLYAGPSNQRGVSLFLFKQRNHESLSDAKERIAMMFNDLAGGAVTTLSEIVEHAGNKGVAYEKFFKKNSRVALAFTENTPNMPAKGFYYYNGSFGMADGQWLVDGDKFAAHNGLDPEGVYGLALQARVLNGIIAKGMAIPVPAGDIEIIAKQYGETKNVSYAEFRNGFIDGSLKKDTMYCIGSEPAYVFDENTLKMVGTEPTTDRGFQFCLLSVKSATAGKLNCQDAACMQHLPGAIEFVRDLGKSYIDTEVKKLTDMFAGKAEKKVLVPEQYFPLLLADMCPAYAATNGKVVKAVIENAAKGMVKTIQGLNFPLGAGDSYRYLQSDYADMFSPAALRVLPDGIVYDPAEKKNGTAVDLTRNPKTDTKENYRAVTMELGDVLAAINTLDCDEDLKGVIERAYLYADTALIITPADPKVPNSLGGSDFDGDGTTVHKNAEYIRIQDQEAKGSSEIPKAAQSGRRITEFSAEIMQRLMFEGIFGQVGANGKRIIPTPVGVMANHASLIQALRVADDAVLQNVLDEVIIPNVHAMNAYRVPGKKAYERRFVENDVCIHDADVVSATDEYYKSDLSLASTRAFLDDAVRMGSSVVGRGIDVNKTGDTVMTGYLGVLEGKDISGASINGARNLKTVKNADTLALEAAFEMPNEKNGLEHEQFDIVFESVSKNTLVVESKLTPVVKELCAYLEEKINDLFEIVPEMSETERVLLEADFGSAKVNVEDISYIKNEYNALMKRDLQTEEKNMITDAITRMTRSMFDPSAKATERFVQVKKAATNKKGTISSFEFVVKADYAKAVLFMADNEDWEINPVVGYEAYAQDGYFFVDGDEIEVHDGMSWDGNIVTDKKVNGVWSVIHQNGKVYLVKMADEYFEEKETAKGENLVLMVKAYDPNMAWTDFNFMPNAVGHKGTFARIRNEKHASALIFSADGSDFWHLNMPRMKKELLNTRMNCWLKNNAVKIAGTVQYFDMKVKKFETFVIGRFVNCNGKDMPPVRRWSENVNSHPAK